MKIALIRLVLGIHVLAGCASAAQPVALSIDTDKTVGRIDEKIYGHFLEHIYHSVNGGLWGDLIWNRSFEQGPGGRWAVQGDTLVQRGRETDVRLLFGDPAWRDYQFTVEAQKNGGAEGFLVLFRAADDENFYWFNFGGWGNKQHALERSEKGQRARPATAVDGGIAKGPWYRIRVRCEGPRIQVWLDDKRLLDFTDKRPHLAGRVGLGTWATPARYRNIQVVALDGKTLFSGIPAAAQPAGVGKHWGSFGDAANKARFTLDSENPLNGELCQGIASDGPEVGVQQTPLCVRKGDTYRGSLWVRGQLSGNLVVRLLDDKGQRLQERQLPAPQAQWRELPFEFVLGEQPIAAENATLQIGLQGKGKVWIDQVSVMPESWRTGGGFRPDLLKAIADLRPPVIRWPGGCYASQYRWKDGVGPQHKRGKFPAVIWDDVDVNSFGTDEFVRMCRAVGAEPLIVVNIGMHDSRDQRDEYCREACAWLEYCNGPADSTWGKLRATNGHPQPYGVKFWEIDNEVWGLKPDDYAGVVRQFVTAMKKVDPSIVTLACGSGQLGGHWAAGDTAVIAQCAEVVDYLSVHHYEDAPKYASGPAAAEKFWQSRADLIAASKNPRLKLYVSEWNAQSTDWRTGLYAGGALNVFERCGDFVGLAGPALFLRHVSATAWDNAFVNFDHRRWFPAPNYVVMKLWRDHYAPNRLEMTGQPGPLNAIATRSQDGTKVYFKAVNPSDQPVQVALTIRGGFVPGKAAVQLVSAETLDARNTLDKPDAIGPVEGKAQVAGQVLRWTMPRWSAGVATVEQGTQ